MPAPPTARIHTGTASTVDTLLVCHLWRTGEANGQTQVPGVSERVWEERLRAQAVRRRPVDWGMPQARQSRPGPPPAVLLSSPAAQTHTK